LGELRKRLKFNLFSDNNSPLLLTNQPTNICLKKLQTLNLKKEGTWLLKCIELTKFRSGADSCVLFLLSGNCTRYCSTISTVSKYVNGDYRLMFISDQYIKGKIDGFFLTFLVSKVEIQTHKCNLRDIF